MQNHLLDFAKPIKREDGMYEMKKIIPTWNSQTLIPLIDIDDIGQYLQPFLDNPEKYNQKSLTAATGFYTPEQMCETWTRVTGYDVRFEGSFDGQEKDVTMQDTNQDSPYYGAGSKDALDWTLAQMEEAPSDWNSFVQRTNPWFT